MSQMNLSRFANPNLTESIPFPCRCPGTPHDEDVVVIRQELGAGEEARAGAAGWASTGGEYFDWEVARDKLISIGVIRWTFLDAEGGPMPVSMHSASLLDEETRNAIAAKLDANTAAKAKGKPLPNRRSARSRNGSRASASPPRTAKAPS